MFCIQNNSSNLLMQLRTFIVAQQTPQLLKDLNYSFDHSFSILDSIEANPSDNQKSLSPNILLSWLQDSSESSQCIIMYNTNVAAESFRSVLSCFGEDWSLKIAEIDGKQGQKKRQKTITKQILSQLTLQEDKDSFLQCQLCIKEQPRARLYIFPTPIRSNSLLTPSIHQIFKLLRLIECYLSLDKRLEDSILLKDPLNSHFSDYLYEQQVNIFRIFVRVDNEQDLRVLQHVGRLTLPEKWIQRKEYRSIKSQTYFLRKKIESQLNRLQCMKNQVITTMNGLMKLAGLPEVSYSHITIETLKQLKSQCLLDKATCVNDLDRSLEAIEERKKDLLLRKQSLLQQKQQRQQKQISQILRLKNEIAQLQVRLPKQEPNFGKKTCSHNLFINSIFSRAQKKGCFSPLQSQTIGKELFRKSQLTQIKENDFKRHDKKVSNKEEQYTIAKKVAAIVKNDRQGSLQFNLERVREEWEKQSLGVDFDIQRQIQSKLINYERAFIALKGIISAADDIIFMDE